MARPTRDATCIPFVVSGNGRGKVRELDLPVKRGLLRTFFSEGEYQLLWRRGWESNPRMKVLQTSPLPLGYRASEDSIAKVGGAFDFGEEFQRRVQSGLQGLKPHNKRAVYVGAEAPTP